MSDGVIATSVYTAILSRKEISAIVQLVPPAAIKADLPASQVPAMIATIGTPKFVANYKPTVVAAVSAA
ncbi:hypothetical protein PV11_03513 [Exophiala sideris]|uniref:Uncharacterized protein n=1 Tax=Exophiala sideris TaxID=1016849 RepID=A0A0D1X1G1_9EURO|nr:hypothetical protein PV11_03513 [Exophiala sideris]